MKWVLWGSIIILLTACGTMEIHNPYEQSISEALAPDRFEVNMKRNNITDKFSGTDFKAVWDLKP